MSAEQPVNFPLLPEANLPELTEGFAQLVAAAEVIAAQHPEVQTFFKEVVAAHVKGEQAKQARDERSANRRVSIRKAGWLGLAAILPVTGVLGALGVFGGNNEPEQVNPIKQTPALIVAREHHAVSSFGGRHLKDLIRANSNTGIRRVVRNTQSSTNTHTR